MVDYYTNSQPLEFLSGGLVHISGTAFDTLLLKLRQNSATPLVRESGGSCCNTLKTLSWLGHHATFSGSVGNYKECDDSFFFKENLGAYGVKPLLSYKEGHTGRYLVVQGKKESVIAAASPAVAVDLTPQQIDRHAMENADLFLAEGMELDNNALWQELFFAVKRNKTPFSICCGTKTGAEKTAVFLAKSNTERPTPSFVFSNDSEARILEENGIDIQLASQQKNILFVITHGCGGSSAYLHGERISASATPAKDLLDATGAGDVFAGVFLHSLQKTKEINQQDVQNALHQASKIASKITTVPLCKVSALKGTLNSSN